MYNISCAAHMYCINMIQMFCFLGVNLTNSPKTRRRYCTPNYCNTLHYVILQNLVILSRCTYHCLNMLKDTTVRRRCTLHFTGEADFRWCGERDLIVARTDEHQSRGESQSGEVNEKSPDSLRYWILAGGSWQHLNMRDIEFHVRERVAVSNEIVDESK